MDASKLVQRHQNRKHYVTKENGTEPTVTQSEPQRHFEIRQRALSRREQSASTMAERTINGEAERPGMLESPFFIRLRGTIASAKKSKFGWFQLYTVAHGKPDIAGLFQMKIQMDRSGIQNVQMKKSLLARWWTPESSI